MVDAPSAVITAVRTSITLVGNRSKRILPAIDLGDGKAMVRLRQIAPDCVE
jgi:hypothetical protein